MKTYSMITSTKVRPFQSEDFSSIDDCVERMKQNGWKCRTVVYCYRDNIYEKKITIDNDGNVILGRAKKIS